MRCTRLTNIVVKNVGPNCSEIFNFDEFQSETGSWHLAQICQSNHPVQRSVLQFAAQTEGNLSPWESQKLRLLCCCKDEKCERQNSS